MFGSEMFFWDWGGSGYFFGRKIIVEPPNLILGKFCV